MERERPSVIFFDIGDTLGTVRLNAAGDRIERIRVLPGVTEVLRALSQRGARLGIISNRGTIPEANVNQALDEAGLLSFFTPDLIFYGPKDSTAIFLRAAEAAGHKDDPQHCLFVGENQSEREFAAAAGLLVAERPEGAL
jgi:bacterial leucyl aminopeptidase